MAVRATPEWDQEASSRKLFLQLFSNPRKAAPKSVELIDASALGPDAERLANRMMRDICTRLAEFHFNPLVTQLSHFGVSEPEREGFVTTIFAPEPIASIYLKTISTNIATGGPVAPSPALYYRRFWHSTIAAEKISPAVDIRQTAVPRFAIYPLKTRGITHDQNQIASFIDDFHARVLGNLTDGTDIAGGTLRDFIAVPFRRMHFSEGMPLQDAGDTTADYHIQGGVFFALGSFDNANDDLEVIDRDLLTLRDDLDQAVRLALAREASAAAERQRGAREWMYFMGGVAHGFKREPGAYASIVDRTLQTTNLPPDLRRHLSWVKVSSQRRGEFHNFLEDFVQYLAKQEETHAANPLGNASKLLGTPRRFSTEVELGEWITEVFDHIRLQPVVQGITHERWTGDTIRPIVHLSGSCTAASERLARYILSELLLNAIRFCSGELPVAVSLGCHSGVETWTVWNDLDCREGPPGKCASCAVHVPSPLTWVSDTSSPDEGECAACADRRIRAALRTAFVPGHSVSDEGSGRSGSGLGLFLVNYIAKRVYGGQVSLTVTDRNGVDAPVGAWRQDFGIQVRVALPPISPKNQ